MKSTAFGTILLVLLSVVSARPSQNGEQAQFRFVPTRFQIRYLLTARLVTIRELCLVLMSQRLPLPVTSAKQ